MVCIAGVLGNKQVALGPLAVEAGIFAFLLLVVTSSAVAELHGPQVAGRLVRVGFVPVLVSLALAFIVLVGVVLVLDGLDVHVPKAYVYFAMGFSALVEVLNLLMRRSARAHGVDA